MYAAAGASLKSVKEKSENGDDPPMFHLQMADRIDTDGPVTSPTFQLYSSLLGPLSYVS
jgi:hypothetical protein